MRHFQISFQAFHVVMKLIQFLNFWKLLFVVRTWMMVLWTQAGCTIRAWRGQKGFEGMWLSWLRRSCTLPLPLAFVQSCLVITLVFLISYFEVFVSCTFVECREACFLFSNFSTFDNLWPTTLWSLFGDSLQCSHSVFAAAIFVNHFTLSVEPCLDFKFEELEWGQEFILRWKVGCVPPPLFSKGGIWWYDMFRYIMWDLKWTGS